MNPVDAAPRGIGQGDRVRVWNDRGVTLLPAHLTERIMPGVVAIYQGRWYQPRADGVDEAGSANVLTSLRPSPWAKGNTQHTNLVEIARESVAAPKTRRQLRSPAPVPRQGMRRTFLHESDGCIACGSCQVACKDLHDLPVGVNWRRVVTTETGRYPDPKVTNLSISCDHCADAPCLEACLYGALHRRKEDGLVLLDGELCVACGLCLSPCPNGAIQYDPTRGRMSKCDMCADLLAEGRQPGCVAACPMRVLKVGWKEVAEG